VNFEELRLCCECGSVPASIRSVGFGPQHRLVVHWQCSSCGKLIYLIKELDERAQEPSQPERDLEFAFSDAQFLESMGIRLDDA
jgi:hypothetical protein